MTALLAHLPTLLNAGVPSLRISRATVTTLATLLVAVIAWFDYATGDFSMAVFYLVPVALATWYAGRWSGWFIALLSAVGWLMGDLALSHAYGHMLMPYWNAAMPALIYGFVVQLLSALQRLHAELEERVERRTASLAKANAELDDAKTHIIEAEKLESIGRLAAGVAHEVKNPLMTITMVADYLAQVVPATEPDGAAMIQDLREAVERANRVINEMLAFARPTALLLEEDDFHHIAESALGFVKYELTRRHITVIRHWCEPAPQLIVDRHRMQQVLVNMLLNAIQAMPDGGTLTLGTQLSTFAFVATIDDTGPGIPAANQAKLFQPFFTTKPPGQGTGLGLSVARQIVKLHGGKLMLSNRPDGGGARVTLHLPIANQHLL